jgi:hypothetical protein
MAFTLRIISLLLDASVQDMLFHTIETMGQHMPQRPATTFVQGLGEFIGTQFFRLNGHGYFK